MELIEKMLGLHLVGIYTEGKRLLEIKLLVIMLEVVKLMRLIALNFMFSLFSFLVLILGIFVIIIQSLKLYQSNGTISIDSLILLGLTMVILGSILCFLTLREKRWLRICRVDKYVHSAMQMKANNSQQPIPNIDIEKFTSFINSVVEQKLKERDEVAMSKPHSPVQ
ncbi:MAG: tetraspanin family protein [Bdellovibrio sp.]|nr:tetraspanin family protein [Bdellovibrio sp.]